LTAVRRELRIDADVERLADVRAAVREVARACEAPATCVDDLVQAVDEAVTNIIVHGYRGRPGSIDLTAELIGDDIVATLEDRAPAFDPTGVPPPDLTIHPRDRRPGGMGVHLMRLAMDSIRHEPRSGGGNILTLTRSRVAKAKEG
jgi:serine/threonine-protein kinase RsbW